jgi:hypothetical protein
MYKVFKLIETGELVGVESCEALEPAVQLVERLNSTWPGTYVLRNEEGNELVLTEQNNYMIRSKGAPLTYYPKAKVNYRPGSPR